MTPARHDNVIDHRLASLETRLDSLASNVDDKHRENRKSIHDIRGDQQTFMDGQYKTHELIGNLSTKLNSLYGTDGGRPGQVDELRRQIDQNREEYRREMVDMERRLTGKIEAVKEELGGVLKSILLKFAFGLGAISALVWMLDHHGIIVHAFGGH